LPSGYRVNSSYDNNRTRLGDIALAAVASLVVQSASATTDVITETIGGEQKPSNTTSTNTTINNNNNSNAVLGSLFLTGGDTLTSFIRINETYTELSYAGNRTIMPPDATTTATINAPEMGILTFNLKPNGISVVEGQSLLVTEGGNKDLPFGNEADGVTNTIENQTTTAIPNTLQERG
jgi:hypothetical protein